MGHSEIIFHIILSGFFECPIKIQRLVGKKSVNVNYLIFRPFYATEDIKNYKMATGIWPPNFLVPIIHMF